MAEERSPPGQPVWLVSLKLLDQPGTSEAYNCAVLGDALAPAPGGILYHFLSYLLRRKMAMAFMDRSTASSTRMAAAVRSVKARWESVDQV